MTDFDFWQILRAPPPTKAHRNTAQLLLSLCNLTDALEFLGTTGNSIIQPELPEFPVEGAICYRERLGGLLRYYYRQPAFIT